jgi:ferritin-like metal-binding protein YciE
MKDLLANQLSELRAAEEDGTTLLPELARAASSEELASMLRSHAAETVGHMARLDAIIKDLGLSSLATRAESNAMRGLRRDCLELARSPQAAPHVRDAAIIAAVQHIEHDEIAGYGCARTWAELLGHGGVAKRLQSTLDEERRADAALTTLAARVNRAAMAVR